MSFSIYAHGVQFKVGKTGFTKSKVLADVNNVMLGDEWKVSSLISALSEFTPLSAAGSPTGSVAVSLTSKMGVVEAKRILGQQIQLIAMSSKAGGKVSLYTRSHNLLLPNEHSYKEFPISPRDSVSFVRELLEHLGKIELNKLGILIEIVKVFAELNSLSCDGYYVVNIQLRLK